MLGVLLAAASPGQQRPGPATAANLIGGALRIRARALLAGSRDPRWDDALAVTCFVAPLLMLGLALAASPLVNLAMQGLAGQGGVAFWLAHPWAWSKIAGAVILAVLALAGLRRATAFAAVAFAGSVMISDVRTSALYWYAPGMAFWVWLGLLAAAGAALSAGPRRGRQVLGRRGAAAAGLAAVVGPQLLRGAGYPLSLPFWRYINLAALAAVLLAAVVCLATPTGRRVLALLAIPGLPIAAFLLHLDGGAWGLAPYGGAVTALLYAPPLLLASGVALARTRSGPGGPGQTAKR